MRLHEVIENGQRFRRKSWDSFVMLHIDKHNIVKYTNGTEKTFLVDDFTADDWEIFEEKIELTESQIREAVEKTVAKYVYKPYEHEAGGILSKGILELLGFGGEK